MPLVDGCSHLLLNSTRFYFGVAELQSTSENDWSESHKRFIASIIGNARNPGDACRYGRSVAWEGDHVRLLLLP